MKFSFRYRIEPANLLVLSMINIYRSMMGMVNIVFTASMILLAVRFWAETGTAVRILISAGILLFPVFQPLMIFLRSRRIVGAMPREMAMDFDSRAMTISSGDQSSPVDYSDLKSVIKISGMLIIYTKAKQGFILNKQVLADKGAPLYDYLKKKVK